MLLEASKPIDSWVVNRYGFVLDWSLQQHCAYQSQFSPRGHISLGDDKGITITVMKNDALAIFLTSKKDLSSLQVSFQDFKMGEERDKKSTRRMLCLLCLNKIKLKKGLSSTPNFIRTLRVKLFFHTLTLCLKVVKNQILKYIFGVKIQMFLNIARSLALLRNGTFLGIFKHSA